MVPDALVRTVGETLQTVIPAVREILSDEELASTNSPPCHSAIALGSCSRALIR